MILENQKTNQIDFPHYKRVGDYLLGEKLGEGSFAKVRVGLHVISREKVAVKIINKEKARKDPYVYKNLRREGRLLQRGHHKHVITIYDTLETENNYYLITDLVSGGEMIDMVEGSRGLPESQVRKYITQILTALQHLHQNGLVHRDLKVENLLLDEDGDIKIIDFGLSNFMPGFGENPEVDSDKTGLTTQCGSPAYAAPELLAKRVYGNKVDVWSCGVVAYALLTGRLPYTVEPFKISALYKKMMNGEMNPIPSTLSKNCRDFILKVLTPNPDKRPTVDEIIEHKWLKESLDYNYLVGVNERIIEDEESRTLNSDVIRILTTSLGFNFSEVISSVQKHRPSRCFATYELLNKKYLKSKSQPKTVSLKEVRREMERSKNAVAIGNSESDSGFENKSSSSETELNKNGKSGQAAQPGYQASTLPRATMTQTPTQNAHATTKLTNLTRHNSQTLPTKPNVNKPLRLPRIDGSLDRSRKPRFGSIGRNEDLDRLRENYDEVTGGDFVRPMMRNKFTPTPPPGGASLPTNTNRPNRDDSTNRDGKPRFQTDVKALIRTYKKFGATGSIPKRNSLLDRTERRSRVVSLLKEAQNLN